jgi:hypothetical protein
VKRGVSRIWARLFHFADEFDPIKIEGTVANLAGDAYWFIGMGWLEFNVDLRTHPQIGHAEKAHAAVTQVNTERVHMGGRREHLD